mgnify:CR=1 FL=1
MSNTGSTDNFGYGQELKRELSFKDVFVYGMLFMVVIAPMSIYGYISKDSHMMAPFVYFVGICAMFFTALSYMKMSNRFAIAGSVYAYVQRGLNHHVGFIAGWLILLEVLRLLASCAALAGSGFFALLTQLPAADLPRLIPGYVVWLNDFSGTLGSFSDTQVQLFTLFAQVGEGTFASLLGDLFSRVVISPVVLPIGAITSFLGGPMFLYLLFKGGKKEC